MNLLSRIFPNEFNFFDKFSLSSGLALDASASLDSIIQNASREDIDVSRVAEIAIVEERLDQVTKSIVDGLKASFITPFDRAEMLALAVALDDIADQTKMIADRIDTYRIQEFQPEVIELSGAFRLCVGLLNNTIARLGSRQDLTSLFQNCREIHEIRGRCEPVLTRGLSHLYDSVTDARKWAVLKELLERLGRLIEHCHESAHLIEGMLLESA